MVEDSERERIPFVPDSSPVPSIVPLVVFYGMAACGVGYLLVLIVLRVLL
jgi:hypothetical protein